MSTDSPVDEEERPESPAERSDSPPSQLVVLPPPNSEPSSASRTSIHPTFVLPEGDPFYNLVARREDNRPRLFPPFSGWSDNKAENCADPYCKHDVIVHEQVVDKYETCESCGFVPAFGYLYRCGVDITGFSHRMEPGQAPVLSPWVSDAFDAGHYTNLQKNILEWQKLRVVQTVAEEHTEHLIAFPVTGVIYGIGDDDDDENPHVDFVEDVSHTDSDQFAEDRPLIQSDTTVRAPSQWDLRDRSISDANIVRNLGLRRFSRSGPSAGSVAESSTSLTEQNRKSPSALLKKLIVKTTKSSSSSPKPTKPTTTVLPALTTQIAGSVAGCFTNAPPTASIVARHTESSAAPSIQPPAAPLTAPPPPPHLEIPLWLTASASSSTSRSTNWNARSSQAGPSGTYRRPSARSSQPERAQGARNSINRHPRRPNFVCGPPRTVVRVPATVHEEYEGDNLSGGEYEDGDETEDEDEDYDEDEDEDEDNESGGCLLDLASRAEDSEHRP